MEMAEAIADAMEQFEKQGINLHNIVISEKGSQAVVESVQAQLKDLPHDELGYNEEILQDRSGSKSSCH